MPAGSYTFTLYTISGTANGTFTVTGSFSITVYDSDDDYGVGDDQLADNSATETGALPTISALGPGAPAGWSVGETFVFGGARMLDGDSTDDIYVPKVAGYWGTETAVYNLPGASADLVVGNTYTTAAPGTNVYQEVLPCFTSGTNIQTITGNIPVDHLFVGDLVQTVDNGFQPIRWIGSCTRPALGNLAPVHFRKGALGNHESLTVSPHHKLLITGASAELLFGEAEILVPAKSLLSDRSVLQKSGGMVTYFHILFDAHEVVFSNNIATESFHPEVMKMPGFWGQAHEEISELFPDLMHGGLQEYGATARPILTLKEGRVLRQVTGSTLNLC